MTAAPCAKVMGRQCRASTKRSTALREATLLLNFLQATILTLWSTNLLLCAGVPQAHASKGAQGHCAGEDAG